MEAIVKIRGEHTLDLSLLTLHDNEGGTINCSATATYSEYSDETVLVIRPGGSNSIGGAGNTWDIGGAMTVDGVEIGVSISSPEPSVEIVSITPTLPSETYDNVIITMSTNVTIQDVVDHCILYGYLYPGSTIKLDFKDEPFGDGWYVLGDQNTMKWKVVDNVITVADVGHGPRVYSVSWE